MKENDSPSWGGSRPGSGRRYSKNPKVSITIQAPATLKTKLEREAQRAGFSLSAWIIKKIQS